MLKKIITIGILLETACFNVGCSHLQSETIPPTTVEVIYSTHPYETGWRKTVTIKNNGLVTVVEQPPVEQSYRNQVIKAEQLAENDIQAFKKLVNDSQIFDLQESYGCQSNCSKNNSYHTLQFTLNEQKKMITFSQVQAIPTTLQQIYSKINQIERHIAP
jgi:hypothetical protein